MTIIDSKGLILVAGMAGVALTGCEQLGQVAHETVENAKQSAYQALDEIKQSGSVEEAKQSAHRLLTDATQQATGLLEQASQYLSEGEQAQETWQPPD